MNSSATAFILAVITSATAVATDRSTMSPAKLIVGEWKSATETSAPDPVYPKSREYFSPIDSTKKTGTRFLSQEDGKRESSQYSIVSEDSTNRTLRISIHISKNRKREVLFTFDQPGTKMLQRMFVTDDFHVDTHHLHVGNEFPGSSKPEQRPKGSGKPFMVRVTVHDDTKKRPVHSRAEIWFRGHGSWWLKRELKYGSTFKKLGTRPSGTKQTLIIYPESRDGKELKVPYMMTDDMKPEGSHRDTIEVEISDTEITVHGLPIKAATGKYELKYKR